MGPVPSIALDGAMGAARRRREANEHGRIRARTMKARPMGRGRVRGEPEHAGEGSAQNGRRLQEPAPLGMPMYKAHRSWRSAGPV